MFSPSSHDRVAACLLSEALPHVVEPANDYSDFGTGMHRLFQRCIEVGEEQALEEAEPEVREAFELLDRSKLPPLDGKHYAAEVSLALELRTGKARELGRGLTREARNALCRPGEMPMTIDLLGLTPDAAVVIDVKTGRTEVPGIEQNAQVLDYLLAASRAYGRPRGIGALLHALDTGIAWSDVAEFDALDLDAHEVKLRELVARVAEVKALPPEARPIPVLGSHCRYCPAKRACPAHRELLMTLVRGDNLAASATHDEAVLLAHQNIKAAKAALALAESIVETYVRERPVYLGNGWWLGEREVAVQSIVAERAEAALVPLLGNDVAKAVCGDAVKSEKTLTKKALASALKKHAVPRTEAKKLAPVERAALEALAKARALSTTVSRRVGEFKGDPPPEGEVVEGEAQQLGSGEAEEAQA